MTLRSILVVDDDTLSREFLVEACRSLGYRTHEACNGREALEVVERTNPDVVRATFDRVIEEKKKRIHEYKDAVGAMIANEEKKKTALKRLTDEVERLTKLRDGR